MNNSCKTFFYGVTIGTIATLAVLFGMSKMYTPYYLIASNGYNSYVYDTFLNRAHCETKMEEMLSQGPIPYLLECSTNEAKPVPNERN